MTSEMASDIFKNVLSSSPSKQGKNIAALADEDVHTVRYWLYAPGEGSCMWDEFYTSGIMAIGWGEIGDLSTFDSKDAMKIKMREVIDESLSYKNAAHATWQFANEMKIGDIVFVKKGMHQIIGRGVVMSDYEYDDTRDDEYKNIRQVDWTHNGEWPHPGQAVMKTLTDITSYTDYVEKLNSLFEDETEEDAEDVEKTYPPYTKEDFLSEVFMPEEEYEKLPAKRFTITNLLKVVKSACDSTITVGSESVKVDRSTTVHAAVNFGAINDLLTICIYNTRGSSRVGVDEVAVLVSFITRTLLVSVTKRSLDNIKCRTNLSGSLKLGFTFLVGCLDCGFNFVYGYGI